MAEATAGTKLFAGRSKSSQKTSANDSGVIKASETKPSKLFCTLQITMHKNANEKVAKQPHQVPKVGNKY